MGKWKQKKREQIITSNYGRGRRKADERKEHMQCMAVIEGTQEMISEADRLLSLASFFYCNFLHSISSESFMITQTTNQS